MGRPLNRRAVPYLFLLPFLAIYATFWVWPIVFSLYLSLNKWSGGASRIQWVGLGNYLFLLADDEFLSSLVNTLYFSGMVMAVMLPLALLLALLLNVEALRWKGLFRSIMFSPIVMSTVVVSMIFLLILDDRGGFLAYFFRLMGLKFPAVLSSKRLVIPALVGLAVWRSTGVYMLFYLAGLQGIPVELYEAARIDGANRVQSFFFITLPQLQNATIFIFTIALINSIRVFDEPYLLTGGGPGTASLTLALNLYRQSFSHFRFGMGSAISVFLLAVILVFTLLFLRLSGVFRSD